MLFFRHQYNKWDLDYSKKNALHIPTNQIISGPNLESEARLLRFYIVINNQMVVPVVGRLLHVSAEETKATLYPDPFKSASEDQLNRYGLLMETFYFHLNPTLDTDIKDVCEFMQKRAKV